MAWTLSLEVCPSVQEIVLNVSFSPDKESNVFEED